MDSCLSILRDIIKTSFGGAMKISIYLHQYITDILAQYGTLDEVINRILQEASKGNITVEDKPPCINRSGASRYDVDINNKEYLELISMYPPNSPHISLRRLIYWFVDNEIMHDLGWQATREYVSKSAIKRVKRYDAAIQELTKLQMCLMNSHNEHLIYEMEQIVNRLTKLKEEVKNG